MPRDKRTVYLLAALVPLGLFSILFASPSYRILLAAAWLFASAALAVIFIRKRRAISLHRNTVLIVMLAALVSYFVLFYMSGFTLGFVKTAFTLTSTLLWQRLLPVAVILAASELVRRILLSQGGWVAALFAFLICLLGDVATVSGLREVNTHAIMMDVVALGLFPSIATGVLCQYVSACHGALPSVVYRLLLTLTPYLIPVAPGIPDSLVSFLTILFPLLLLFFLRALFEKRQKRATASPRAKWLGAIATAVCVLVAVGMIAVVSGQFRYSTIVIATGSMTGALEVGDVVTYERYEGQSIKEGQVIVFERDRSLVVHRVVEVEHINGQTRYYTKGDANETRDVGYVTKADVVGVTHWRIPIIGYPSLWMHRLFELGS